MNRRDFYVTLFLVITASVTCAHAFKEPVDTAGTLTVRINGPQEITNIETPIACEAVLNNAGTVPVSGLLRIEVIDDWRVEGKKVQPVLVAAGKEFSVPFTVVAGKGTYNAWYPIHVRVKFEQDRVRYEVHPILLVRTNITEVPRPESAVPWKSITVPEQGQRSLVGLPVHRVVVKPFTGDPIILPVGWRGTEAATRAAIHHPGAQALPETRRALFVHPPWYEGRSGSVFIEMPVTLPTTTPLRFECAVAIQGQMPSEPPSDGVTFRLYVAPLDAAPGVPGTLLFGKHTDSKTWEPVSVDLAAYAGQSVVLQLETHPGPKNDTTCDRGLWGDVRIAAGDISVQGMQQDVKSIALGEVCNNGTCYQVTAGIGRRGLLDGTVSFISESDTLTFDGFKVTVLNDALDAMDGACVLRDVMDESRDNKCRIRHRFESASGNFDLVGELYLVDGKALRATFALENTPPPRPWMQVFIEDAALGAWNQKSKQIYAGVGNVIRNPESFNLYFDGHQLATSFVGFDFDGGASLVLASDAPPSHLEVTPASNAYTLHTPVQPALTFIPAATVWEGVKVWRAMNGLKPAGGVQKLAGRFVFDLWGGKYGASADALEQAFRYGLTNSAVVWHNWQRWGYDYRLPDICPPNPRFGTLEEFQRLAAVCREHEVIFAPHDNYIDFYPDADGFSYGQIGFNKDGHPIWGWLNEGRGAQAFRWNVEAMRPFLERNLEWIREFIQPTGFFIDVWSSIGPYEAWTRDGYLQDRLLHRKIWGESFAWIREYLGDNAPQISESGHDQLIGYLDGAQANHLRVDPSPPDGAPSWMTWPVQCEDAERIPWSDMAYHDRFVLHGAGYENRYCGGLRTDLHGMYSDDYICTEVLTGHPAMVDAPFQRDVVRKYWLTNDMMTALALKQIEHVTFDANNLHRQQVCWDNGGKVWVNRGETPWDIEGRVLPQYGYYADLGTITSAIEEKDGVIVEWSKSPKTWFVNARPVIPRGLPAAVKLKSLTHTGDRNFEVVLEWEVSGTIEEDLIVYIHFMDNRGNILFQADTRPQPPTSEWKGTEVVISHGVVPETVKAGTVLSLRTGLWKPGEGRRLLRNNVHADAAVRLANVLIQGSDTAITGFDVQPVPPEHESLLKRMNPEGVEVDFGGVITNGACRITQRNDVVEITPLPGSESFNVRIDVSRVPFEIAVPKYLECEDSTGTIKKAPLRLEGEYVQISCVPDVFSYRLKAEDDL